MPSKTISLGDLVRDIITGYDGVVVAKTSWLTGCDRFGVQSRDLKDGKLIEPEWFDDTRLLVIESHWAQEIERKASVDPGGPQSDPRSDI